MTGGYMGISSREGPWIFIHDTDKVEGDLMVLFFGLVFSVSPPGNFSAGALGRGITTGTSDVATEGVGGYPLPLCGKCDVMFSYIYFIRHVRILQNLYFI